MKTFSIFASAIFMSGAMAWPSNNNPSNMSKDYEYKLSSLPVAARLSEAQIPWASSYWPHQYGGIAFRWNGFHNGVPSFADTHVEINEIKEQILSLKSSLFSSVLTKAQVVKKISSINNLKSKLRRLQSKKSGQQRRTLFSYDRPNNRRDLERMSNDELYRLSPSEKYDAYQILSNKSNSFVLTNKILATATPSRAYWEGICNGWSAAAISFEEPRVQTVKVAGKTLVFNSSDLKALTSYYQTQRFDIRTGQTGRRCKTEFPKESWYLKNGVEYYNHVPKNGSRVKSVKLSKDCVDMDAGAFHVILANQIGKKDQGFVVEAVRDREVWNQPVFSYSTKEIARARKLFPNRTSGTDTQVHLKVRMDYANDGGRMYWGAEEKEDEFYAWENPTNGTDNYRSAGKDLEYILDLDRSGKIIGGHWLSYERADFVWNKIIRNFVYYKNISSLKKGNRIKAKILNYMYDLNGLVRMRY